MAIGYSRDSFCRFKELYDNGGELAFQEISRKKPILASRTAPEIEARIVEFSLEQPAFGQIRAATAESYESRGVPEKEAERRAWATVDLLHNRHVTLSFMCISRDSI